MGRILARSADRRPFPLAPLLALALLMAPNAVGSLVVRGARSVPEPPQERTDALDVEPEELLARPGRHVGQVRRLHGSFSAWSAGWNPFLTRFGPAEFRALEAWTDDQFLWQSEADGEPALRLFVRRGSAAEWALESAKPHARYEFTLAVREVFAGRPWCEVLAVHPTPEALGEGALVHARRAVEAMAEEQYRRAQAELERALAAPLPPRAKAELERLAELCRAAARTLEPNAPR